MYLVSIYRFHFFVRDQFLLDFEVEIICSLFLGDSIVRDIFSGVEIERAFDLRGATHLKSSERVVVHSTLLLLL